MHNQSIVTRRINAYCLLHAIYEKYQSIQPLSDNHQSLAVNARDVFNSLTNIHALQSLHQLIYQNITLKDLTTCENIINELKARADTLPLLFNTTKIDVLTQFLQQYLTVCHIFYKIHNDYMIAFDFNENSMPQNLQFAYRQFEQYDTAKHIKQLQQLYDTIEPHDLNCLADITKQSLE